MKRFRFLVLAAVVLALGIPICAAVAAENPGSGDREGIEAFLLRKLDFLNEPAEEQAPNASVRIVLEPGQTAQFGPSWRPGRKPVDPSAGGSAGGPSVSPVSVEGDAVSWDNGLITAVKCGKARLRWEDQTVLVTVCPGPESLILMPVPQMLPGDAVVLQTHMEQPVKSRITYTVSDESILRVDDSGRLEALQAGTATVAVVLPDGTQAMQSVCVTPRISEITLSKESVKVDIDGIKCLQAAVFPQDSAETLVWSSSDPAVASVDENGVVSGWKEGTAVITCKSGSGAVEASCQVKVCDLIQVAITFDDGPSNSYTGLVLDLLQKYDVHASFFLVGNRIKGCEDLLQRMVDEGHEIGYHTWAHTYFKNMTAEEIKADYQKFRQAVEKACDGKVSLFRSPGGFLTNEALECVPVPHIMWQIDTKDWKTRDTEAVKQAILNGLQDGAIILLHDIHYTTYTGTEAALQYIFEQDLDVEFMTVTELLSRDGTPPKAGQSYYAG